MRFDQIAEFTLGTPEIPESTLAFAATLLIDTLGVAAGALALEAGQIARDHAVAFHGAGQAKHAAHLLFDGRQASIPGAAFALATQIDNLDAHDGYNPTKGHIGCAIVPALCAFAQARPELSGRDALAAMVIAYEVATRAAIALHASVSDYHTSGAWNALGVAALGCRLRGHDPETLRHALGIAEYHGPRSQMMREIANPSMLHDGSGMGALVGSMAALMAEQGFTGAPAITVEDAAPNWDDLGSVWTVERNYIKPYPVCRWAHAAIGGLAALRAAYDLTPDKVASIDVNTFQEASELFPGMPETSSQAQYSLPFALAVMLVKGMIGPDEITGAGLRDPQVAEVLPRITVREATRHSERFPIGRWSDVELTLTDGTVLRSGDVHARGGPEEPMAVDEVAAKFHVMAAALPEPRRQAIWDKRAKLLDPDTSFESLAHLLRGAPEVSHA